MRNCCCYYFLFYFFWCHNYMIEYVSVGDYIHKYCGTLDFRTFAYNHPLFISETLVEVCLSCNVAKG